jgi:predicted RNA-binding protein YlxR (DUF448 family)
MPAPAPITGPDPHHDPQRRCFVTGTSAGRGDLLRFVVSPAGAVVPDVAGRLPGRGLWLQPDRAIIEQACRKNLFRRAARATVTVPDDLADEVERQILARCLDWIGLARRAGEAVFGYERVRIRLGEGGVAVLLAAFDGDPRDRSRLKAIAGDMPVIDVLSADELGRATGRERSVHGAITAGKLARAITREAARLARLSPWRVQHPDSSPAVSPPPLAHSTDRVSADDASRGHD